jgi:hypothetical protein
MGGRVVKALFLAGVLLSLWATVMVAQADPGSTQELLPDAFAAPDLPSGNVRLAATSSITPGYFQTSEYMAGSVAVGIVLVQCDGSLDPCTENWTAEEKQLVYNKIVSATHWWASLEPRAHLSFVFDDHFSAPLPTHVEPITRPYTDMEYWIADAMGALGYNAPFYITRVRDYTNQLRVTYHTDWAFTIFVVDSSNDSDGQFSTGYFAFACLGGPFLVMTYNNSGYGPDNMDIVAAHEIGHIFHALDQYSAALQPCTLRSGYLFVENQNSAYGSCALNVSSIMRNPIIAYADKAIDPYAAGQVGWRDSDGDGILDPLDTDLPVGITSISQTDNRVTVSGTAEIIPYPSPTSSDVTINTLTGVQYRFDKGDWQPSTADDGVFDGTTEGYHFAASLRPGRHVLEVAASDSAGSVSAVYATSAITILDAIDGGLTTQLAPTGDHYVGERVAMSGEAFELQGGIVADVQYRVNGGSWQSAQAQDGTFDSDDEMFSLALDSLAAGRHLIEARAVDVNGKTEVHLASQPVTIKMHATFLPMIMR